MTIKVGVMFANGGRSAEPQHAIELARGAEAAGYESLWAVQHVVMPIAHASRYPYSAEGTVPGGARVAIPDPFVWLGFAAAITSTIRLATGVVIAPQQHALVLAKQAATLDRLSGGRLMLGVGAGWLREEFEALAAPFDGRGALLDEQIDVLRAAWTDEAVTHVGPRMSFTRLAVEPKPARGTIPIVVGGHTAAAVRRAGRTGDGFFPLAARGPDLARLITAMREIATDHGRDAADIEVTADAPRTAEQAIVINELSVDRVVLNAPDVPTDMLGAALAAKLDAVHRMLAKG
jgi:probable F420-dependent oxidoreductase